MKSVIQRTGRDPVPETKGLDLFDDFGSDIIESASESRALVVIREIFCADLARLAQSLEHAKAELSAAKRVDREVSCGVKEKNSVDDLSLLRHILDDENLSDCSTVVITEARRRTAMTDILYGQLKNLLHRRPDLLLVFDSSAPTLERGKLLRFFSGCRVFDLPRTTCPVQIVYSVMPLSDYLLAATLTIFNIIKLEMPIGDIIVFLAGEEDINQVHRLINTRIEDQDPEIEVVSVCSQGNDPRLLDSRSLSSPRNNWRVILTENNAEAPFEFVNVLYAIDCGLEKMVSNNPKLWTNTAEITRISRATAERRARRAGRGGTGGRCFRLYTHAAFLNEMGPTTLPEILRTNLAEAILRKKAFGISTDFVDCPSTQSMAKGSRQLYLLEATDYNGSLTKVGRAMAEFPVGPVWSRILMAGVEFRCSDQVLTIVAMVQTGNVFLIPEVDLQQAGFVQHGGDHMTLLAIFEAWKESGFSRQWCLDNFVQYETMNRANEFRNQLISIMNSVELEIVRAKKRHYTNIRKAITAGLIFHAAEWDKRAGCYRAEIDNRMVHINPRSALFDKDRPEWVVYDGLHVMSDGKEYMTGVTSIMQKWLVDLSPQGRR